MLANSQKKKKNDVYEQDILKTFKNILKHFYNSIPQGRYWEHQ